MLVSVIGCFVATFVVLGWIGWRYFLAPAPAPAPRSERQRAAPPGLPAQPVETVVGRRTLALGLKAHAPVLLASALALAGAATVLALSGSINLAPLNAYGLVRQEHIQVALNPETLVPPPPLPPSTFVGTERQGLETADRDWGKLNPEFMAIALKVFARLEARGYPFALLEGYRSPMRQDALADAGTHVTNARAYQSKHQYGLALDAAPVRNGRLVITERDPWAMEAYLALGEEAERAGLTWGGRWKLKDYGHIEARGPVNDIAKRN